MIFIKEKSMKNLFELSEEEKNSIRGLHESHKDKPGTSLNEQGARPTGLKVEPGSFDISRTKTSQSGSLSGDEDTTDNSYLNPNNSDDKTYAANEIKKYKDSYEKYIWDKRSKWRLGTIIRDKKKYT